MRKKILTMSIAAVLTAVTSSSVMAFDSNGVDTGPDSAYATHGPILVPVTGRLAAYQGNLLPLTGVTPSVTVNAHPPKEADEGLRLYSVKSNDATINNPALYDVSRRGDALIFPFFNQKDDWGTEFVVRNTSKHHAIVAKVSVHRSSDSLEIIDFNVYLSGADVVRFKIENGKLTSEDGSIVRSVPAPSSNLNDIDEDDFASKAKPFVRGGGVNGDVLPQSGYVVVYGMAQARGDTDDLDSHDSRYHNQHARLFANYRRELDVCRPGWRIGHRNAMVGGTYIRNTIISRTTAGGNVYSGIDNYSIAAPNQAEDCRPDGMIKAGNFFGDVGEHLSGTVRLYNGTNAPRDMMLPATAIKNFTSENKIIWAEGEIANLQDRRIVGNTSGLQDVEWALYNEQGIRDDAKAFAVVNTAYTFNADSVANQLVITQPYKRILVQLGNDDGYWRDTSTNFGTFSFIYNVFNEHEKMQGIEYTHSPWDSAIPVGRNEVEIMKDLEVGTDFENENGFALLKFVDTRGHNAQMPAIITQMIGSTVAGVPQVNWIYSPTDLFTNKDCPNPSSDAANPNELICN